MRSRVHDSFVRRCQSQLQLLLSSAAAAGPEAAGPASDGDPQMIRRRWTIDSTLTGRGAPGPRFRGSG
eukprot:1055571-Ditylum_brightwellii.AAC.1